MTPVLYNNFTENGFLKRLPLFLRTILENPGLARHVKTFSGCACQPSWVPLSGCPCQPYFRQFFSQAPTEHHRRLIDIKLWSPQDKICIQAAMNEATKELNLAYYSYPTRPDHTFAKRWRRRIFNTSRFATWDAITALLLCFLPNLEVLHLESFSDQRLHHRDGTAGFDFLLRVLESSKSSDGRRRILRRLHTADLSFMNCVQRKRVQSRLCHSLPPLKCFRYEAFPVMNTWAPSRHSSREIDVDPMFFRKRLLNGLKRSLEKLTILVRLDNPRVPYRAVSMGRKKHSHLGIACFKRFTKLRVLTMSARLLIGLPRLSLDWDPEEMTIGPYRHQHEEFFYRTLPENLQTLRIIDCPDAIYGFMRRFLQSSSVPSTLKRIELAYTYYIPGQMAHSRPDQGYYEQLVPTVSSRAADMEKWMAGEDSEWHPGFPGEEVVTKKELEDLASSRGIILTQYIDEDYREKRVPSL